MRGVSQGIPHADPVMGGRSLGVPRLIGARVGVPHSHWSVGGCSFGHPHSDWSIDGHLLGIPAPIGSWVGAPSSNWALIGHLPGRPLCDWLRDRHSLGIPAPIGLWPSIPRSHWSADGDPGREGGGKGEGGDSLGSHWPLGAGGAPGAGRDWLPGADGSAHSWRANGTPSPRSCCSSAPTPKTP